MKRGVTLNPYTRDVWAKVALDIAKRSTSNAEALRAVEDHFEVSNPTARNLISRGRYLEQNPGETNVALSTFTPAVRETP